MSQYFIKGVSFADTATVAKHGIGYAFDANVVSSEPLSGGPNGAGKGCFASRSDTQIGNLPGYQWEPISDSVLFGFKPGASPADYARKTQLPGETIKLADGNDWLIPTAQEFYVTPDGLATATRLPQSWRRVGDNWLPGEVVLRYAELWKYSVEISGKYFAAKTDGAEQSGVTIGDVLTLASLALQANYYLSPVECSCLGLLANTPDIMDGVVSAVFGLKKLDELLKKT